MVKRKNDILLIAVIVLAAAGLWLGLRLAQNGGAYVYVTIDGSEYGKYPLDTDAEVRIGSGGKYNLLIIKDGCAQITEASCPNKLCIKQGKIKYEGQSIVCLPNKVVVEIVGGEKSQFDAVVK